LLVPSPASCLAVAMDSDDEAEMAGLRSSARHHGSSRPPLGNTSVESITAKGESVAKQDDGDASSDEDLAEECLKTLEQ